MKKIKDWRKEKIQKGKKAIRVVARIWAKQYNRPFKEIMEEMDYKPKDLETMKTILKIEKIAKKRRQYEEIKALNKELKWCKKQWVYAVNREQFAGYINGIREAIRIIKRVLPPNKSKIET